MKTILVVMLGIITLLLCGVIVLTLEGLIFWGIGALVVNVFNIAYSWGFWEGVVVALIFEILTSMFRK